MIVCPEDPDRRHYGEVETWQGQEEGCPCIAQKSDPKREEIRYNVAKRNIAYHTGALASQCSSLDG